MTSFSCYKVHLSPMMCTYKFQEFINFSLEIEEIVWKLLNSELVKFFFKMAGVQTNAVANIVSTDNENDGEIAKKSFKERLDDIPFYSMTLTQLCNIYSSVKDRNETLKKAFDTGEYYVNAIAETAKPIVVAATNSALTTAKPFIGEVNDPVGQLDTAASGALAKVEEKFPFIRSTPAELAESTKGVIMDTTASCIQKIQGTIAGQAVNQQVDNAISLSELMVELCFPTDGSCKEDVEELDKAEDDETKGAMVRVTNLKDRLKRRSSKKLMTMKPVQVTVDAVHYAQERIAEMNQKLTQGSNYAEGAQLIVHQTSDLLKQKATGVWDKVYSTTMYIPSKAIQISGEVYISNKEMVFAYTKAHSVAQMPQVVADMAEKHYAALKDNVSDAADKAVAFVMVPTEVVSEYILSSRPVQWIIPNIINADEIKILEDIDMEEIERELQEGVHFAKQ